MVIQALYIESLETCNFADNEAVEWTNTTVCIGMLSKSYHRHENIILDIEFLEGFYQGAWVITRVTFGYCGNCMPITCHGKFHVYNQPVDVNYFM